MSEAFRLGKLIQFLLPCIATIMVAHERELKAQSQDARLSGLLAEPASQAMEHQPAIGRQSTWITPNCAYQYRKDDEKLVKNGKSVREYNEVIANNLAARKKCESGIKFSPSSPNSSIIKAPNSFLEAEDTSCTIKVVTDNESTRERGAGNQIAQAVLIDQKLPNQQRNNIQQTIDKIKANANPSWGTANQPGFFVNFDQSGSWSFPSTGSKWGTGAGRGVTSLTIGANGSINGNSPNMFNWSAQLGPIFEHVYNVPGIDRTALAMGIYGSLNPLRHFRNGFNIYTNWSGIYGLDQEGSSRFQNVVQTGMLYSFANVNIIPDPVQRINIPEKGFYLRIQPTWLFALDGQLSQSRTQAYLGWSENHYPFSMAIEVGPEFIQASGRDLQTFVGSFFDLGYYFTPKIRAYLRYRPALSFGGSDYPAAPQLGAAGMAVRF